MSSSSSQSSSSSAPVDRHSDSSSSGTGVSGRGCDEECERECGRASIELAGAELDRLWLLFLWITSGFIDLHRTREGFSTRGTASSSKVSNSFSSFRYCFDSVMYISSMLRGDKISVFGRRQSVAASISITITCGDDDGVVGSPLETLFGLPSEDEDEADGEGGLGKVNSPSAHVSRNAFGEDEGDGGEGAGRGTSKKS